MNEDKRKKNQQWHNNSSHWIWGVFYFNPDDDRIFVPKRIPIMGWTINFANAKYILVLAVVILLIILLTQYFK